MALALGKGDSDEIATGEWRTGELCLIIVKHVVKLSCMIIWKAEN